MHVSCPFNAERGQSIVQGLARLLPQQAPVNNVGMWVQISVGLQFWGFSTQHFLKHIIWTLVSGVYQEYCGFLPSFIGWGWGWGGGGEGGGGVSP